MKSLYIIVENKALKEPIGTAEIHRGTSWNLVPAAHIGTYVGKKECWEKGLGIKITIALLEMSFICLGLEGCQAWSVEYNSVRFLLRNSPVGIKEEIDRIKNGPKLQSQKTKNAC